jgi:predicted  nucleic acid-binding Zn-ribbon protein
MLLSRREKIGKNSEDKTVSISANVKEKPTTVLQKLVSEEASLKEEQKSLASSIKEMQSKVKKEIKNKQKSIHQLRADIGNLKISFEELTNALKIVAKA